MGFRKVGEFRLSKSGNAVEIVLDDMPSTLFKYYFYIPLYKAKEVLEKKKSSTPVSLLVSDHKSETEKNEKAKG